MKQNLIINIIPFELSFEKIKIYYSEKVKTGYDLIPQKLLDPSTESNEKVCWSLKKFNGSKEIEIDKNNWKSFKVISDIVRKTFRDCFFKQGLIVYNDFIDNLTLLEKIDSYSTQGLNQFKEFAIRVICPYKQRVCYEGNIWCLSISYQGKVEITENPLSTYSNYGVIKKVLTQNTVKYLNKLTEAEKSSTETKVIVNNEFRWKQGWPVHYYKSQNKYSQFYDEISDFYSKYIKGKNINVTENEKISIFESGFQTISEKRIIYTKKDSNELIFGENKTHFSPYHGIKEYGPYQSISNNQYKFFFIFHEDDKEIANSFYACLTKGVRGFPGLFRFVGLNVNLDKQNTIKFKEEDPILEIKQKLNSLNFDPNINYIGIYISRIKKDDPDPEKIKIYHKLKKILLEKNITSQVVYKDNIAAPSFNYYLPNIAIAILAKLGGIPWRLKRPIEYDLIIGVGAFRQKENTYVGTAMTFKNDGKFVQFDSSQANTIEDISNFLKNIILEISKVSVNNVKRIIIHYYKKMNNKESEVIGKTLNNLGLKIPYIVLNITENTTFIPFDTSYSGKMPVSGTCIIIRNGFYLLCNNERYSNTAGAKIRDYPYPVQIKISKTNKEQLSIEDSKSLIDQVYQFSRMYWVSVKQKGKPVTVLYSKRIAEFTSSFDNNILPSSNTAKKTLWFL